MTQKPGRQQSIWRRGQLQSSTVDAAEEAEHNVFPQSTRVSGDQREQGGKDRWDGELGGFVHKSPSNSHEEEAFGIALLLSDWQGGQVGGRRLIPWSCGLVRVNLEN
jgi:hypothetical protein